MSWRWVPDREPDDPIWLTRTFPTQGEAETWLGEFYPDLVRPGSARSACTRPTGWSTARWGWSRSSRRDRVTGFPRPCGGRSPATA